MNTIMKPKYAGDGGVAQRNFIQDAQVGWKAITNDPHKHLGGGVSQYDYIVECVMLSVTRAQPRTVEHVMPRTARAQPRTIFPSDSIISGIR